MREDLKSKLEALNKDANADAAKEGEDGNGGDMKDSQPIEIDEDGEEIKPKKQESDDAPLNFGSSNILKLWIAKGLMK